MVFEMALPADDPLDPIVFDSNHGALGGSVLKAYRFISGEPALIAEVVHDWGDGDPGTDWGSFPNPWDQ